MVAIIQLVGVRVERHVCRDLVSKAVLALSLNRENQRRPSLAKSVPKLLPLTSDTKQRTTGGVLFVVVACFSHVQPRSTPKQTKNSSRKFHIVSPFNRFQTSRSSSHPQVVPWTRELLILIVSQGVLHEDHRGFGRQLLAQLSLHRLEVPLQLAGTLE